MASSTGHLRVHYLPQFVASHALVGSTVAVIDLLRASTTICQALAAGARDIVPFVEVSDTAQAAAQYTRADVLLGGERGGARIEGFDLGNSPAEYTPEVVFGRRILFTTTNGTRALEHARLADRVIVAAMVNLSAAVRSLRQAPRVDILCAGTAGHVTREDILAAGALTCSLLASSGEAAGDSSSLWPMNEMAERARSEWEELLAAARAAGRTVGEQLTLELQSTPGGRNLLAIGQDDDLALCAELDRLDVVPELDAQQWRIHLP